MNKKLKSAFQELENARLQMQHVAEGCDERQQYYKPSDHEWSIVQVMTHLMNAEQAILTYIRGKISNPVQLKKAGFQSGLRSLLVSLALKYVKKLKAPAIVANPTDTLNFGQVKQAWSEGRDQLRKLLEEMPDELIDKEIFRHPRAGMMNIYQTLIFMREHVQHHMAQIRRLEAATH